MKVDGYGPHANPERLAEVTSVMAACAAQMELIASAIPADWCVVVGRAERITRLRAPTPATQLDDGGVHLAQWLPRWALARHLADRTEEAAKVQHGPPDQPQPAGARLFVVVLDEVFAVTWSQPENAADVLALLSRVSPGGDA